MKRVVLTLALLAAACAGARGQAAAGGADAAQERRRDIRRLLELTRGVEVGREIIRQSTDVLRKLLTALPEEQREKVVKVFEEEMLKEFTDEKVFEMIAPLYEKHLTTEDVKALIDFYQTPLGRKVTDTLPVISREAYQAGTARGDAAGARAVERIRREGLLASPETPPPPPIPVDPPGRPN